MQQGKSQPRRLPQKNQAKAPSKAVLALLVIFAFLVSGCTQVTVNQGNKTSTAKAEDYAGAPAELLPFYKQVVTWKSCEGKFQCADIEVPLNYAKPSEGKFTLAATRLPASSSKKLGSIVLNPGGPGGSGVDFAQQAAEAYYSTAIRKQYDIVGFDPRGVQRSSPVKCFTDAQMDADRQVEYDLGTPAGLAKGFEDAKKYAEACKANSGPNLAYIDTESSAKDMDILRAVMGNSKLDYMGFSYGTKLGAVYAGLFPARIGKLTLDGALDPSLGSDEIGRGQAMGFERALRAWVADCQSGKDCPIKGTVDDGMKQIRDMAASYTKNPQQTPENRKVNGTEFMNAVAYAMYSTQLWGSLSNALTGAINGDSSGILMLADYSADRDSSGKYMSNTSAAFTAINCLDYPNDASAAHLASEAAELKKISPTFGEFLGYSDVLCKDWPFKPVGKPAAVHAKGAPPILVIGTTRDPATPYEWAELLAKNLDSGVLLTYDGDGHTAYGNGNKCISNAVDGYYLEGKVPADGLKCS